MTGGYALPGRGLLSAAAIALTLIAFIPYLMSIIRGATRPHVFSWIIWGSTTFVVFLAQLDGGGGVGAWPIGISGLVTILIALLAYLKRADVTITGTDRLFFVAALSALPAWYLTTDPLWAVVILTTVDVLVSRRRSERPIVFHIPSRRCCSPCSPPATSSSSWRWNSIRSRRYCFQPPLLQPACCSSR